MALSHRPSPPRAVGPLDRGVADIQRARAFGQVFHANRVLESCLFKGGSPPQDAAPHRGTDYLRNRAIQIKRQRLHRLAQARVGVSFLQPPTADENPRDRTIERLREILETLAEESHAHILLAWGVAGGGQRSER